MGVPQSLLWDLGNGTHLQGTPFPSPFARER